MLNLLTLSAFFFLIGFSGVLLFRNSIIIVLICLELLSLSITCFVAVISLYLDSLVGETFIFFILLNSAVEISIGMVLVTLLFRDSKDEDKKD